MANVGKTEPAYDAASITPSDTTNINTTRGLYVGGAGSVKVDTAVSYTHLKLPTIYSV